MEKLDDEMMIEHIAQALRDEPMRKPAPSFDARVMASIRWSHQPTGVRAITSWLVRPRRISLSPVTGLAAAACFMFAAYLGGASVARQAVSRVADAQDAALITAASHTEASSKQMVQFVFVSKDARSVSLVGDFNDWNAKATPLASTSGNIWTVEVPLTPGRYNYIFMVDGTKTVVDPAAPQAPTNEFGQPNSVITVGSSSNE